MPGNVQPGTALKADTGWVIHIHLGCISPELLWKEHIKGFGLFLVLVALSKNIAFTLHPCTHTGKKKKKTKTLKLFTTMDIEISFEAL